MTPIPTVGDLRAALGVHLALRCTAVRKYPQRLAAIDAGIFAVQQALVVLSAQPRPVEDTKVGDYRPTLYTPEYARTELATKLMEAA